MRYLSLIRHAKSSWDDPGLTDYERPLNARGRRDMPRMARRAGLLLGLPDHWLSSPALRAQTTARGFAAELGVPADCLALQPSIYEAEAAHLLDLVRGLDDGWRQVWLFGHNPGLSQLGQRLSAQAPAWMPTCAVAQYVLPIERWTEAGHAPARLRCYLYPRQLRLAPP